MRRSAFPQGPQFLYPSDGLGGIAISFPLPVYTADDNGGLCIGRRCINAPEGLGAAAVNKRASVYTEALLAHYYQRL